MYSARTVPPSAHGQVLHDFGNDLRSTLEDLVGDFLPERCWSLAQLGITHGGLGIRDPGKHAAAAYVASVAQARGLCQAVDESFDPADTAGGLGWQQAVQQLASLVLEPARPSLEGDMSAFRQKQLSQLLDAALRDELLRSEVRDTAFQGHIGLCSLPGAGAWLTSPIVPDGREMDAPLFQVALKRRLRMKVFDEDNFCPACGDCLDTFGDHALVCPCKGDRTLRHNRVRDEVFKGAVEAAMRPEKEKAGLLPGRPDEDGVAGQAGDRRPADVWLPRGPSGRGEALDFACTSALRSDLLNTTASNPAFLFDQYENFKRQYKNTGQAAVEAGFVFTPMICEAHSGAWAPNARRVLDRVSRGMAACSGEETEVVSLRLAQRISVALHRANARAILKRTTWKELEEAASETWVDSEEAPGL